MPLNADSWRFCQVFGEKSAVEDISDVDIVSAIEFDGAGDYLAAGDRGGRIVIFEREEESKNTLPDYKFFAEFQSHEPEFDYLKSVELEEKINRIRWLKRTTAAHFLLTTNDKTIKLWKVFEKKTSVVATTPPARAPGSGLYVPSVSRHETTVTAVPKRLFSNAHAYHINSISTNSDGETYLSADDLRVNLWSASNNTQSFNIVDIKPANMDELTEVITAAEFHPSHCHQFAFSSSKGTLKLCDLREAALCDKNAKVFEQEEDPTKSFFSEIISSISDVKFSHDGRYLVARDYLTLKIWDMNMERGPLTVIQIHPYLRAKLCDLYENDCIFDKFEVAISPDGKHITTGSYSNHFMIFDLPEAVGSGEVTGTRLKLGRKDKAKFDAAVDINPDDLEFARKSLHTTFHPYENTIATASTNNLFVFSAMQS